MGGCVTLCYLYFFLHSCIISMLFFDVGILPKNSWRLGTLTLNFKIRSSFIYKLLTRVGKSNTITAFNLLIE
jgi:hypothetical protein